VGILIFFIHHAADSIQAMTVISNVSGSLHHAIERQFSDRAGELDERWQDELAGAKIPGDFEEDSVSLRSDRYGYIQAIDEKAFSKWRGRKKYYFASNAVRDISSSGEKHLPRRGRLKRAT
jgi:uncharacterized membrane protein